jgi:hypothetical protein
MKRRLPEASHDAYALIQPKLNEKQREVFNTLVDLGGKGTNQDIATKMGIPLHHVTPRTGELISMGKVKRGKKIPEKRAHELEVVLIGVQTKLDLIIS